MAINKERLEELIKEGYGEQIKSLEPMEITIAHTKKETKISLSNRLAGMVEKESITGITKNLIDLVKEIQKL